MNNLNDILSGEQAIQLELRVPDADLIKIGATVCAAILVAMTLSLLISKMF